MGENSMMDAPELDQQCTCYLATILLYGAYGAATSSELNYGPGVPPNWRSLPCYQLSQEAAANFDAFIYQANRLANTDKIDNLYIAAAAAQGLDSVQIPISSNYNGGWGYEMVYFGWAQGDASPDTLSLFNNPNGILTFQENLAVIDPTGCNVEQQACQYDALQDLPIFEEPPTPAGNTFCLYCQQMPISGESRCSDRCSPTKGSGLPDCTCGEL